VSRPRPPEPASLAVGLLLGRSISLEEVLAGVQEAFSAPVAATGEREFPHTRYYEREMGPGLTRAFVLLDGLWDPGSLGAVKRRTNELEQGWTRGERRRANLDPGFLGLGQFVLATGKPAAHRIYLGEGIYGEVEYVFENGGFRALPWTYADYREPSVLTFFDEARESHRRRLKERR